MTVFYSIINETLIEVYVNNVATRIFIYLPLG
jgi:hypothetical protein